MAFPSLLNARLLRQLASLSALLNRRPTKGAFFILLVDSTVDMKPPRVTVKCVWYVGALPKLMYDC